MTLSFFFFSFFLIVDYTSWPPKLIWNIILYSEIYRVVSVGCMRLTLFDNVQGEFELYRGSVGL